VSEDLKQNVKPAKPAKLVEETNIKNTSEGAGEDLLRTIVSLVSVEAHSKTIIEHYSSQLREWELTDEEVNENVSKLITEQDFMDGVATQRRELMKLLMKMFGDQGDKRKWCTVKHLAQAQYTIYEVYQALSDGEVRSEVFNHWQEINAQFIEAVSALIGVEITSCASCFTDIMKGETK